MISEETNTRQQEITFDVVDFYVRLKNKDIHLNRQKLYKFEAVDLIRRGFCVPDDIFNEVRGFKVYNRITKK